jgi:hypothetical protein
MGLRVGGGPTCRGRTTSCEMLVLLFYFLLLSQSNSGSQGVGPIAVLLNDSRLPVYGDDVVCRVSNSECV